MEDLSTLPPAKFSRRVHTLLAQACPDQESEPFFNRNMTMASELGLTYAEGLQYVIQKRARLIEALPKFLRNTQIRTLPVSPCLAPGCSISLV